MSSVCGWKREEHQPLPEHLLKDLNRRLILSDPMAMTYEHTRRQGTDSTARLQRKAAREKER